MHAFDVLGDPVRRRILDLLAAGEASAGEVVAVVGGEFGITQPAVSRQLRILREHGFATVRPEGARRLYSIDPGGIDDAGRQLERYRGTWEAGLAALHTEVARGRRERRAEPLGAPDERNDDGRDG
ncbi:ArsR family transcriptional regulator [Agromyces ramosus]|uniref:ArsR family transcriptional regulator n=1 Tax=Agromyces ramosus TaxID=33879 RepID=A0A4Q7M8A8_9MICO|nr:metalloregulator ArsR/SmtB family transcription factor [Agromyces ramosus]RZS64024.1 ArsR family transcriptional regulator [Agromyces ramosus]